MDVVACARRRDRVVALGEELGEGVLPLVLDVRDRSAVGLAVANLPERFAEIDVLVNNAGLALGLEPAYESDLDEWDQMIDTNCKGLAYCTRAVLPGMVARRKGLVVNIGSTAGRYPYRGANVYGATKAFVRQFSLNLRSDLAGSGVKVTCIEPGMSGGSEFSLVRFRGDGAKAAEVYEDVVPLNPDDIAEAVRWVASLPPHVNVNTLEMMPVAQSFAALAVQRADMGPAGDG